MSRVKGQLLLLFCFFFFKLVELVGGGSLINGAYPVLFYLVSKLTPGTLGSQSADLYNAAPSNSKLQLPAAANPPPHTPIPPPAPSL